MRVVVALLVMLTLALIPPAAAHLDKSGPSSVGQTEPTLESIAMGMPVFTGARFHPRSRVTVTLASGGRRHTRVVRTTGAGTFVVRFTLVVIDPCRGTLTVTAVDSLGARARFTHLCRPPSVTDPYRP